jgi:hypothetical protein
MCFRIKVHRCTRVCVATGSYYHMVAYRIVPFAGPSKHLWKIHVPQRLRFSELPLTSGSNQ